MEIIETVLMMASWVLLGLGWVIFAKAFALWAGWRVDARVASLRRRLADVTALRARDGLSSPDGPEIGLREALADAAVLFREYERMHVAKLNGAVNTREVRQIMKKAERNAKAAARCESALKARAPLDPETATRMADGPPCPYCGALDDLHGVICPFEPDNVPISFKASSSAEPSRPGHPPIPESQTPADSRADALGPWRGTVPRIIAARIGTRPVCAETEGDCA